MEFGKTLENHYKPYFCGFCAQKIVMENAKSARNHYKPFPVASEPNRIVMEIAKTTRNHSKLVGRESKSGGSDPQA